MSNRVVVATDFSRTPGPRAKVEGDYSGELFRELLSPLVRQAIDSGKPLVIILDGTAGYSTSFLEEAFGGLVREDGITANAVIKSIDLVSSEEPYLADDIHEYIVEAERRLRE